MTKVDIDDVVLLLVVRRKPDPATGLDTLEILQPTNTYDATRISKALAHAQGTLLTLTKKALADAGVRDLS